MAFLKSNLAKDVFYLGYTSYPFLGSYPKEIIWLENELKITLHIFFPFDSFYLFYLFIFLLYKIVLVLPYISMNLPRVYTCSPSWTPLPPPSPSHPSGSSQCTSPKHPVSCIEPGLVIHFTYDIIHVSMPFSQIIPPSTSLTESKRLFYTSVSLLLLTYKVIISIFLNSIYMC